jgi:hypothetical protein
MPLIEERFTAVKTARVVSLGRAKASEFPTYRTIFMMGAGLGVFYLAV